MSPAMIPVLLAANMQQLWHFVPLVVVISLVYGATRHEWMAPILSNAVRFGVWIFGFVGAIFAVLFVLSWLV